MIIIRVEEESINKVIPDLYQQEFTRDQLLNEQKFEMSFDSFYKIPKYINSSFEERKVGLNVESPEIVLFYYLFTNLKVDLVIPSYIHTHPQKLSIFFLHTFHTQNPLIFTIKNSLNIL